MRVSLCVNDESTEVDVDECVTLADLLRDSLRLTGTRLGCEHGVCGSCTVLVDGAAVRSCLMFAVQAEGADVWTVEGLADGDRLHPLQSAFHHAGGLQCGFCTAGLLMTAVMSSESGQSLTRDEIRETIGGNLCRCTGYAAVLDAIGQAIGRDVAG
jgi:aerobic-type carbon monoxide dehydrogenase small subunit (CoxS/CutS family)